MKKVINLTLYNRSGERVHPRGSLTSNLIATRVEGENTGNDWFINQTNTHCES